MHKFICDINKYTNFYFEKQKVFYLWYFLHTQQFTYDNNKINQKYRSSYACIYLRYFVLLVT